VVVTTTAKSELGESMMKKRFGEKKQLPTRQKFIEFANLAVQNSE
jgi:hypothetical protein